MHVTVKGCSTAGSLWRMGLHYSDWRDLSDGFSSSSAHVRRKLPKSNELKLYKFSTYYKKSLSINTDEY